MRKPITTVFCAVWSGDKDRHALLAQHHENLLRQTSPVEIIYVFDNDDVPPRDLPALKLASSQPLTIYEAWNLALAACRTPYVMNLNLDDRLCTDAVETLEAAIQREGAALVGGEWQICYSQEDTNRVGACFPASDLPFDTAWPPARGTRTRLGSGTGNRGTYGPATLWRLDCHVGMPRYPYRTTTDIRITGISDAVWWDILTQHFKRKVSRVPMVIGNYHSHPESQAEFRNVNEHALLREHTVSLV